MSGLNNIARRFGSIKRSEWVSALQLFGHIVEIFIIPEPGGISYSKIHKKKSDNSYLFAEFLYFSVYFKKT